MRSIAVVACLVACGKPDAQAQAREALAKLAEFKDAMCACKDTKCAVHVSDGLTAWAQTQSPDRALFDRQDTNRATQLGEEMGTCMQRAMGAIDPTLDTSIDELGKRRDAMCACKHTACADSEHERYVAVRREIRDNLASADQKRRVDEAEHALEACWQKLH